MGVAERRTKILKILSRRRYETIGNLSRELGVSERTIRRDILVLSLSEPIYTQSGRYGGGVYMLDSRYIYQFDLEKEELELLNKLCERAESSEAYRLTAYEIEMLKKIIKKHSSKGN